MESKLNGTVTYLALQRLAERAWDEGDSTKLYAMSAAVDAIAIRHIRYPSPERRAI